ncbi:Med18 protein-domain-containing protein [Lipomyces arxii]|uniref:Med18 protein-domain-containing protein n=1 Tax=Lipomyces arxii TaxID=56418 RepID=UPI0034CF2976
MQRASLYGTVHPENAQNLLLTLIAIAGNSPIKINEHHIQFSPISLSSTIQQQQQLQLESSRINLCISNSQTSLSIPTIPESAKRQVQIQHIHKTSTQDPLDVLLQFIKALDYVPEYAYLVKGQLFVLHGVIVTITQIAPLSSTDIAIKQDSPVFMDTLLVHAYVDILTTDEADLVQTATTMLETVKIDLAAVVELMIPDRAVQDPRVSLIR